MVDTFGVHAALVRLPVDVVQEAVQLEEIVLNACNGYAVPTLDALKACGLVDKLRRLEMLRGSFPKLEALLGMSRQGLHLQSSMSAPTLPTPPHVNYDIHVLRKLLHDFLVTKSASLKTLYLRLSCEDDEAQRPKPAIRIPFMQRLHTFLHSYCTNE